MRKLSRERRKRDSAERNRRAPPMRRQRLHDHAGQGEDARMHTMSNRTREFKDHSIARQSTLRTTARWWVGSSSSCVRVRLVLTPTSQHTMPDRAREFNDHFIANSPPFTHTTAP